MIELPNLVDYELTEGSLTYCERKMLKGSQPNKYFPYPQFHL